MGFICTAKLQAFSTRYWLRGQRNANTKQKERKRECPVPFNEFGQFQLRLQNRTSQGNHECNELKWIGELTVIQTPLSFDKYNGTRIPYVSLPKVGVSFAKWHQSSLGGLCQLVMYCVRKHVWIRVSVGTNKKSLWGWWHSDNDEKAGVGTSKQTW